jgi:regulatory protein
VTSGSPTEDPLQKARTKALRLLQIRPRTKAELCRRLAQDGFGETIQHAVVQELERKGLVDDVKFARYYATQAALTPSKGPRAILKRLVALGVDRRVALEAVQAALGHEEELKQARALAIKHGVHLKGLDRSVIRRRLFGLLIRRGFSSEVAMKVVHEMVGGGSDVFEDEATSF